MEAIERRAKHQSVVRRAAHGAERRDVERDAELPTPSSAEPSVDLSCAELSTERSVVRRAEHGAERRAVERDAERRAADAIEVRRVARRSVDLRRAERRAA